MHGRKEHWNGNEKTENKIDEIEDFKDNESLEKMVEELRANGTNVVMGFSTTL